MTVAASVQASFSPVSISEPHNPTSSIILVKRLGSSSSYSFSSTVTVWTLFSPNCPLFHRRRLPLRQLLLKKPSSSLITKNALYTTEGLPSFRAATTKLPTRRREKTEFERDAISILNDRIRRDHSGKKEASRPLLESEEADKYIQLVKEQQQRGLQKLKGGGDGDRVGSFSYKVDPYTLRSGDYVVHKKVGIGRFIGIKFDLPNDSTGPIEYVFIEYADGMAKLPVKQASRVLYRYNL